MTSSCRMPHEASTCPFFWLHRYKQIDPIDSFFRRRNDTDQHLKHLPCTSRQDKRKILFTSVSLSLSLRHTQINIHHYRDSLLYTVVVTCTNTTTVVLSTVFSATNVTDKSSIHPFLRSSIHIILNSRHIPFDLIDWKKKRKEKKRDETVDETKDQDDK